MRSMAYQQHSSIYDTGYSKPKEGNLFERRREDDNIILQSDESLQTEVS